MNQAGGSTTLNESVANLCQLSAVLISKYEADEIEQIVVVERHSDSAAVEVDSVAQCWGQVIHSFKNFSASACIQAFKQHQRDEGLEVMEGKVCLCHLLLSFACFLLNDQAAGCPRSALFDGLALDEDIISAPLNAIVNLFSSLVEVNSLQFQTNISRLTPVNLELILQIESLGDISTRKHDDIITRLATDVFQLILGSTIECIKTFSKSSAPKPNSLRLGDSKFVQDAVKSPAVLDNPRLCHALGTAVGRQFEFIAGILCEYASAVGSQLEPRESPAASFVIAPSTLKATPKPKRKRKLSEDMALTDSAIRVNVIRLADMEDQFRAMAVFCTSIHDVLPFENIVTAILSVCGGKDLIGHMLRSLLKIQKICVQLGPSVAGTADASVLDDYVAGSCQVLHSVLARMHDWMLLSLPSSISSSLPSEADDNRAWWDVSITECLASLEMLPSFLSEREFDETAALRILPFLRLTTDSVLSCVREDSGIVSSSTGLILIVDTITKPLIDVFAALTGHGSRGGSSSPKKSSTTSTASSDTALKLSSSYFLLACELYHTLCNSCCTQPNLMFATIVAGAPTVEASYLCGRLHSVLRLVEKSLSLVNDDNVSTRDRSQRLISSFAATSNAVDVRSLYGMLCVVAADTLRAMSALCVDVSSEQQLTDHGFAVLSSTNAEYEGVEYYVNALFPFRYYCACTTNEYLNEEADSVGARGSIYKTMFPILGNDSGSVIAAATHSMRNSCGWLCLLGTCLSLRVSWGIPSRLKCSAETNESIVQAFAVVADHTEMIQNLFAPPEVPAGSSNASFSRHFDLEVAISMAVRGIVAHFSVTGNRDGLDRLTSLTRVLVRYPRRFLSAEQSQYVASAAKANVANMSVSVVTALSTVQTTLMSLHQRCEMEPTLCCQLFRVSCVQVMKINDFLTASWSSMNIEGMIKLLTLLQYGFQSLRKLSARPKADNVASSSLSPAEMKDVIVRWCKCSLQTLFTVAGIVCDAGSSTGYDYRSRVLTLTKVLVVLDAIIQQPKFDSLSTSISSILQMVHAVMTSAARDDATQKQQQRLPKMDLSLFLALARTLSICSSNYEIQKYASLVIVSIVQSLSLIAANNSEFHPLHPQQIACLSNGLYSLLDHCSVKDKKNIYNLLNRHGKTIMDELHSNYVRDYKFAGKA
jgi:hypothetical protein